MNSMDFSLLSLIASKMTGFVCTYDISCQYKKESVSLSGTTGERSEELGKQDTVDSRVHAGTLVMEAVEGEVEG